MCNVFDPFTFYSIIVDSLVEILTMFLGEVLPISIKLNLGNVLCQSSSCLSTCSCNSLVFTFEYSLADSVVGLSRWV